MPLEFRFPQRRDHRTGRPAMPGVVHHLPAVPHIPPLRVAMLTNLPLALAVDLQPGAGAVECQVEWSLGSLRQRDADSLGLVD